MSRKHRIVHLISFVAIIVSLFSPILTLPVIAEDESATPDVTLTSVDDGSAPIDQELIDPPDTDPVAGPSTQVDAQALDEPPAEPGLTPVVPVAPVISDATCGEGIVYSQTAAAPVTDGVSYQINAPDAAGSFTVTATLTDASMYRWADSGLDGWTVVDNTATATGTLELCPVPEPEDVPEESGENSDQIEETSQHDGTAVADDSETETDGAIDDGQEINTDDENPSSITTSGVNARSSKMGPTAATNTLTYNVTPEGLVAPGTEVAFQTWVTSDQPFNEPITFTLPTDTTYTRWEAHTKTPFGPELSEASTYVSCTSATGSVTCQLNRGNTLNPNHYLIWTVFATVDNPSEATCQNDGILSSSVTGSWAGSPTLTGSTSVACYEELTLTAGYNIPAGESVGLNEPFTYTLTVTNNGQFSGGSFTVQTHLSEGLILSGDSPFTSPIGTSCQGSTLVTCTGSSVQPGAGNAFVFEISVVAVDMVDGDVTSAACDDPMIASAGTTGIWHPDSSPVNVSPNIECFSNVDFSFDPLKSPVVPGEAIEFLATIENTGDTHITGLVTSNEVMPQLPDGLNWIPHITFNGEPAQGIPPIMAPGDVIVFWFESPTIPTDLTLPESEWCKDWTISSDLTARFSWGDDQTPSDSGTVQVNCTGLSIEQSVSSELVAPGDEVEFTIKLTNLGNTMVSPLMVFHDSSETGNVFSNWRVSGGDTLDCGLVEDVDPGCTYLTLDPGNSAVLTITGDAPVNPTEAQCAPVSSQAVFVYGEALTPARFSAGLTSPYTQIYSEPVTTQLDCVASFTFTNEPLESPVVPGETIGYEFTVHNNGTLRITSLVIVDEAIPDLPEDAEWTITSELNGAPLDPENIEGLDPGDTLIVTIVSSAIPHDLTVPDNEWCTSWTSSPTAIASFAWSDDQESTQSATVQVNCASLSIEMDINNPVPLGGQVEYDITITNHGNVTVPVIAAADLTEPSAIFTNWSTSSDYEGFVDCIVITEADNPIVLCVFEYLMPGHAATLTISADAPALPTWQQCAVIESQAMFLYENAPLPPLMRMMSSPITPPVIPVFSEKVSTQLDCQPDVTINKTGEINTGENDRVDAGDTITYTIDVTNSGNVMLYDIVVTNDLADLEWDKDLSIAELLPGETETFTAVYTITQADLDAGYLETTASVGAFLEPSDDDDNGILTLQVIGLARAQVAPVIDGSITNTVTERVELTQEPGIELAVSSVADTGDDDELNLGDTITYTFTVTNSGNVTLTDIAVIDEMDGLVFTDGTTLATLAPGQKGFVTATYMVTQVDVDAGSIVSCADVTATDPGNDPVSESDVCVTNQVAQPDPVAPTPEPTAPATPEVTATPDVPATPSPGAPVTPSATEDATQGVTKLPDTGHGTGILTPIIWIAATIGVLALGIGGATIRRSRA